MSKTEPISVNPLITRWLGTICALIVAMVTIGGITRLTGSGLSITEWKPLMGTIPPLHTAEWERVFALYRESPQYQQVNAGMSLTGFKWIFFWEYLHRLVGRLIGLFVFVPGVYFVYRRRLPQRLLVRIGIGFLLGGLQGALGWFMVLSGLSDLPQVSHFRLAAHFSLALLLLAYFTHLTLAYANGELESGSVAQSRQTTSTSPLFKLFTAALALQIVYGAFVAGLHAGLGFNTFPLMAGQFFPANGLALDSITENFLQNPTLVQWVHRTIGWVLFISGSILLNDSLFEPVATARSRAARWLGVGLLIQFSLGVATLLSVVAIPLAVTHQFGAAGLVILWTRYRFAITRSAFHSAAPAKTSPLKAPPESETLKGSWNH